MIVIRFSFVLGKFKTKKSRYALLQIHPPVQAFQSKGLHKAPLAVEYVFTVL